MKSMIHSFIAIFLFLFSSFAGSRVIEQRDRFFLSCWNPTTHFLVEEREGSLKTIISHPHGTKFTPFFKGTVTAFQLNDFLEMSRAHENLSNSQTIDWPLEDCEFLSSAVFRCENGELKDSDESIRPLSIESTLINVKSARMNYDIIQMKMTFYLDDKMHSFVSDYSPSRHCTN